MTIFPSPRAWTIRSVEMLRIRALVWKLSVTRPIWAPVKLIAGTPRLSMAIAIRATLTCSPVESSMSISRAGGRLGDLLGQRDQLVGRVAARRDDDQDLLARGCGPGSPAAPRPGSCPNRRRWSRRTSERATARCRLPAVLAAVRVVRLAEPASPASADSPLVTRPLAADSTVPSQVEEVAHQPVALSNDGPPGSRAENSS